jgi:pimeloyl-ACP methyl ester carboxylesterase
VSVATIPLEVQGIGRATVELEELGEGAPFLLLHRGAGPASMRGFAELLADRLPARVIVPTHPGFALTERPAELTDIRGLARLYSALLEALSLDRVTVVGNSIGGWIAVELGLLDDPRVGELVLLDAVGLYVAAHPVTDVAGMAVPEIMRLSFHDPTPFLRDPASLSEQERAVQAASQAALSLYAPQMTDPSLGERLQQLDIPTLVLWGASDGIVDAAYGRAYSEAIANSRFELLADTGHMPQMESPERVLEAISQDAPQAGA